MEISRARDRAELVTDDAAQLRERLEAVTGERISALEAIVPAVSEAKERAAEASKAAEPARQHSTERTDGRTGDRDRAPSRDREPARPVREISFELELEL